MFDKELITIPEFVQKFSISRTQTYREIGEGRLRLTKRGRRSLIAREDALVWLNKLQKTTGQPQHV